MANISYSVLNRKPPGKRKFPDKRFIEEILCRKESNSGEPLPSNVEGNPERSLDINQETSRD